MEVKSGYKHTEVGSIPIDWEAIALGNCAEIVMGQSPPGSSYNRIGAGSPLINGPTEFTNRYPIKIQWTTEPARFCKPGDLLICVRGSSTGRTNYSDGSYAIGRGVAALRATNRNDTVYLTYQVIAAVTDLLAAATGSTFPSVDAASFKKIVVPLPTKAEQEAIAGALSDADALIESLEQLIAKKRQIKQGAMQELLTGKRRLPGFSGEWHDTALIDIADGRKELFDDGDWIESEHITTQGIRLVQTGNIGIGTFVDKEDKKYIYESSFVSLRCKEIKNGDLLEPVSKPS